MISLNEYTKMLLIADVHYGIKSGGDNNINYLNWMSTIDDYFRNMLIPTVKTLKEHGERPFLVICGDFFDNRISLRVDVMNRGADIIEEVAEHLPVIIMAGNHDCYFSENADVNGLLVFRGMDNVYTVHAATQITYGNSRVTVDMFPWLGDKKELGVLVNRSTADVALIHADINGMRYASNTIIADGVDVSEYKGKRLYSGHIHKRQETKKVTYIGCPYEMDRSDMGNTKGIYVIGKDSNGKLEETFIPNEVSPRFVNLTYTEFVEMSANNKGRIDNNYVEITYGKEDKVAVANIQNNPSDYSCKDITFKYVDEDVVLEDVSVVEDNLSILDTIEEYIRSIKDITPEQRQFLLDKNKEYVERVLKG